MLWPSRCTPLTTKRAGLALALTLVAAAACADRSSTAPQRMPGERASKNLDPSALASLSISPNPVESGDAVTGTITLAAPAPSGGAHIIIKPFDPLYVAIDSNLVVPQGATSKTFTVITYASPFVEYGTRIDADWGASHISMNLALKQVRPGRPLPIIRATPDIANFGSQAIGTASPAQDLAVQNIGTAPLTLGVITTTGPFTQTNTCTAPLAPNTSCTVSVRFAPTAAGSQTGKLLVPGNSQGVPPLVVLAGTGFVAAPAFTLTPTSIGFGSVLLGEESSVKQVKIKSTGNAPLVISSLTLGGTNPGDFSIWPNGCNGASLNPGASCTASVTFLPTRIGARSATVTIASNASGGPGPVALSGTGAKPAGGGWAP